MNKTPLILIFKDLEIDFAKIKHGDFLEKIFKSKPVAYLPTLVYCALFDIIYENLMNNKEEPFSLITSYQELKEKFKRETCTLSNALRSLEEAKLIVKNRCMVDNDQLNSRLKYKYVLNIKFKFSVSTQKNLQSWISKPQN